MSDRTRIHVQKNPAGWEAIREGSDRACLVRPTKKQVIEVARKIAKAEQGQLIIHNRSGNRIQKERTYRNDPFPPKT
jgi:hypothetical protein